MKLKNLIYGVPLAVILLAVGTGCRKSQFNINKDINNPTDSTVTYDVVLPAALHATGSIMGTQWGTIQNWMGFWARSGTYAPSVQEETYQITTGFGNGIWNACYDNNYDYNIVQTKAHAAGADFYEGIARIMKAHNFQILVDVYGNVPYTQSLKGSANPTPAYDKGIDIYKDLLNEITVGINLIKNASVTATSPNKNIWLNDIMFGDPAAGVIANVPAMKTKWAKFGNTLKLRLLIHAYAVAAIDKAVEIGKINTEGSGYLGVGENAQIQPGYKSDKPNPFYGSYKANSAGTTTANNVYYAANEWGIGYYAYNGDPRESRFYEARSNGLTGVAYGLPPVNENASAQLAGIGPGVYKTAAAAQPILTSAESFFLQAEARWRNIITAGPTYVALTNSGISESFTFVGATGAAGYISGNAGYADVDASAPSNAPANPAGTQPVGGLYTILSQKWFALNAINTLEVWTDYRRVPYSEVKTGGNAEHFVYGAGVGYDPGPPLSVAPQNTSTRIPVRYLYPQTEYNYNPANVGGEGVVDRYTKIFWDIN